MIHATIVGIKYIDANERKHKVSTDHIFEGAGQAHVTTPNMEITPKKTARFDSFVAAINGFLSVFQKSKSPTALAGEIAMLVHQEKNLYYAKLVELLLYSEGKVSKQTIINPLWKGLDKARRDRISNVLAMDVNAATQSQLFAMVAGSGADSKWMQAFQLKDRQQNDLYSWEQGEFPRVNNISPEEMVMIASNIVNYAKLPPLPVSFKQSGKACFFSVSLAGGKVLDPESAKKDDDSAGWGWLRDVEDMSYEIVGERSNKKQDGLRISAMGLTMIMDWALSAPVIIHEVSHYVDFVTPNPYRLNQGKHRLSYKEYENIFAGHGASFTSIFARALIDFYEVNEDEMYDSLTMAGLDHFWIKSIRTEDIIKGMDRYIVDIRQNED